MTTYEIDDMFKSGAPAFKFTDVGDAVKGTIVAQEVRQQTDFATGEPKVWKADGKPMLELVITLDTGDDVVRVFARGEMHKAIKSAVFKAKAARTEIGGVLVVKYTGDGEPKEKGMSGAKLYAAAYKPPADVAVDDLFSEDKPKAAEEKPAKVADDDLADALDDLDF